MTRRYIVTEQDLSRAERDELRRARIVAHSEEGAHQEPPATPSLPIYRNPISLTSSLTERGFDLGVLFGIFIYYLFAWIIARAVRFAMMRPITTKQG